LKAIDANIFIHAAGGSHPYRDPCRKVLTDIEMGRVEANVDTETLQEVMYVYWYRKQTTVGLQYVDRLLVLFPSPISVDRTVIFGASEILAAHPNLDPRDAVHAAVVMMRGLEGIISADHGYDPIRGVTRFDPMDL
jgi:predicted nucleic acid-binding protein